MRVRYTAQAFADREDIFAYLDERNRAVARSVKEYIGRSVSRIASFPLSAPLTEIADVRELSLVRYPYKIYYRVAQNEIWIIHIRDARRRPFGDSEE
jgi:plasmid stabilization system protein ParE